MKISYNWLKQYVNTSISVEEISEILTDNGLEVEGVEEFEQIKGGLKGIVIGHIIECAHIENTEHLSLTKVDIGTEHLQIVCGAPNVAVGQKVLVATSGSIVYTKEGSSFTIKKTKIRGYESNGMICAEDELGLGKSHEGIMVLSCDAEIGKTASKHFNISSDWIFEIGLTPNRSDAMSHTGVARDLVAAIHNRKIEKNIFLSLPNTDSFKPDNNELSTPVEVLNNESCIRYNGLTLTNVKVGESPNWLKMQLEAVGLRPINVVVDITQYVMLELGQPLHAFDYDKIEGGKVVVKNLEEGTIFQTLDGVERKLNKNDLMICDTKKGMCIAGVFGGNHSGVNMQTSKVFLESACFNTTSVRKTARHHGLHTDASFRYERGTDVDITIHAIKRAALLIKELTGCKISSEISEFYPNKIQKQNIKINIKEMNSYAGHEIPTSKAIEILKDLDFEIKEKNDIEIIVLAPLNRVDVTRPVDVYEEVFRIFGYNNIPIPEKSNTIYPSKTETTLNEIRKKISDFLSANGFFEIMCNSQNSLHWYEKAQSFDLSKIVTIKNPLSRELNVMRISMMQGMLQSINYNINHSSPNLNFFEIGRTYFKHSSDTEKKVVERFSEENILSLIIIGNEKPENWKYKAEPSNFFTLKSIIERLFKYFGIYQSLTLNDVADKSFSISMQYTINDKPIAKIGLIKPEIAKISDIENMVWYAEINLDLFLKKIQKNKYVFKEIAKYPTIRRDLAILIDEQISFDFICKTAMKAEKKLLKNIDLFDVYTDKKLGENKKSYAIRFLFRSEEKTLTDKDVDAAMERIIKSITEKTNGIIR